MGTLAPPPPVAAAARRRWRRRPPTPPPVQPPSSLSPGPQTTAAPPRGGDNSDEAAARGSRARGAGGDTEGVGGGAQCSDQKISIISSRYRLFFGSPRYIDFVMVCRFAASATQVLSCTRSGPCHTYVMDARACNKLYVLAS